MELLFNVIEKVPTISWRGVFEHTGRLKGLLIRVPLVASGYLTSEVGLAIAHLVKEIVYLKRKSGLLFTALYLKQCQVALQRFYAGSSIKEEALPVMVSLTRSRLPRIIPRYHRKIIYRRDERADRLVQLYLSWFGLSKLIPLAKPVSKATFSSISQPTADLDSLSLRGVLGLIKSYFKPIHSKYLSWISQIPLDKGLVWEPTWKSTPMDGRQFLKVGLGPLERNSIYPCRGLMPQLTFLVI